MPPRRPCKRQRRESWESAFDNKEAREEARLEWIEEQKKKEKDPGEYTDRRGIPSAPPSTLSLAFTSIASSSPSIVNSTRGPVPSLITLAAKKVSLSFEDYHPDWFREGRLPEDSIKELLRALARSDQGWKVDIGNWVRLGMEFGSMAMDRLPEIKEEMLSARPSFFNPNPPPQATELINTPYHRHLPLELLELTSSLSTQPATSPLLHLVQPLLRKSPMNILTSLSLAGSEFVDEQASCLRGLKFLISLDLSRTRATDAAVKTLASALYIPPDSGGERRGLWQLKAWTFRACGGITDRAATSLRDFPFLTYVDVRETSSTLPTFPLLLSNLSLKSPLAPSSTWTPLDPPPTSIHEYLYPPTVNRTPLTLFIHHPTRSGLAPPPRLPSRSTTAQTTFVSAPFTRSLPSSSFDKSEPPQVRREPVRRAPATEEAIVRRKKGSKTGATDLLASILASVSSSKPPVIPPARKSNPSTLSSSSPNKYSTNPFGSSSPAKPPPKPKPKPSRPVRARSSSSDIEIIDPPPPPPPLKPRPGPSNPFAPKTKQPTSSTSRGIGGGATSFNLGRGGTKASTSKVVGGATKAVVKGAVGGSGGFLPRPKERKAIGEGGRALPSSSSFFFKKFSQ